MAGDPAGRASQDRLRRLADRIPGARLVTVDAGHLVHTDAPDAFLAALRSFGL
ncbi:alpha/beta fold hydrolase [Streptomyces sp. NPDC087908]|uniref:alpha/beta fold hydrolase n=1 Tax=unclassified Streptomyces TaxID=2593676 RepID=UPI00164FFB18|nr:hypothetical protein [Streptomyces sp. adm13(2018)]